MAVKSKEMNVAAGRNCRPDREFVITRILDAPRALVFRAWTDPKHMAAWWGPQTFTNPTCELDPRPGGKWYIQMRGADGIDHPCQGVYREVAPPERLVFTIDHSSLPDEWHDLVNPQRDKIAGQATARRRGHGHIRRARRQNQADDPRSLRVGRDSRFAAQDGHERGLGAKPRQAGGRSGNRQRPAGYRAYSQCVSGGRLESDHRQGRDEALVLRSDRIPAARSALNSNSLATTRA